MTLSETTRQSIERLVAFGPRWPAAEGDEPTIDYLAGELNSPIKHEFVAGVVYAMAGARNTHNDISGNVFASMHTRLRGRKCRPYVCTLLWAHHIDRCPTLSRARLLGELSRIRLRRRPGKTEPGGSKEPREADRR